MFGSWPGLLRYPIWVSPDATTHAANPIDYSFSFAINSSVGRVLYWQLLHLEKHVCTQLHREAFVAFSTHNRLRHMLASLICCNKSETWAGRIRPRHVRYMHHCNGRLQQWHKTMLLHHALYLTENFEMVIGKTCLLAAFISVRNCVRSTCHEGCSI